MSVIRRSRSSSLDPSKSMSQATTPATTSNSLLIIYTTCDRHLAMLLTDASTLSSVLLPLLLVSHLPWLENFLLHCQYRHHLHARQAHRTLLLQVLSTAWLLVGWPPCPTPPPLTPCGGRSAPLMPHTTISTTSSDDGCRKQSDSTPPRCMNITLVSSCMHISRAGRGRVRAPLLEQKCRGR